MWLDSQNISEQSDQLGAVERRAVTKYKWELMDRFPKTQAVVTAARELTASEYRISFSGYAALQQIEQLTDLLERLPESESLLRVRSEEHTTELQSRGQIVYRLLLDKNDYNHIYQDMC